MRRSPALPPRFSARALAVLALLSMCLTLIPARGPARADGVWQDADVGTVGAPGGSSQGGGVFTVTSHGQDIAGGGDSFHFVYQQLGGEAQIVARLTALHTSDGGGWAKAGLMIRTSLDRAAPNAFIAVTSGNGAIFQDRRGAGATTNSSYVGGNALTRLAAPQWLKLSRRISATTGASLFAASVSPDGSAWTQVGETYIPAGAMAASGQFYVGLALSAGSATATATATFDSLSLTQTVPVNNPPLTDAPALSVDVAADRRPISDDIYGMNSYGVDPSFAREVRVPVQRWGGDGTTRYNWLLDSSNAGGDWYFMGGGATPNPTPGAGADAFVHTNQSDGSASLLTIPVIGWVNGIASWNCSYPKSRYPAQQSYNPYVHPNGDDCGNGLDAGGNQIADTNVTANNLAVNATWMEGWIAHLIDPATIARQGRVAIYQMDNEPSGWGNTHRDVHPGNTGYDELINDTLPYMRMIKKDDPQALIDGPGDFGWPAYIGMGKSGDDAASHGVGLAEYYLQRMHANEQNGVRLLDYFDEHYYPTSDDGVGCLALCPTGDGATQSLRLQSTRSLWDPTYVEKDWIGKYYGAIGLIPRFKGWVAKDYPGTKLAITEYNWGGLDSISGALAQADVLGIFGREGLDLATMWGPPASTDPGAFAFRIYRNYDGQGGRYGDTWVRATSADQGSLAIYGAQRASDGALTLMVINKTAGDLRGPLALANFSAAGPAQVYRYSDGDLSAIVRQPDQAVGAGGFTATYPANSISLVVLPSSAGSGGPTATTTVAATATASASPTQTGTATASATQTRTATATATATATPNPPDLAIRIRRSGSFRANATASYLLRISNVGRGTTGGEIMVTDRLPSGSSYSPPASLPDGWFCSTPASPGTVVCLRGANTPLAAGMHTDLALGVRLGGSHPALLVDWAMVTTVGDSNQANNSARLLVRLP